MTRIQVLRDPRPARDQFSSEDLSYESQNPPPHPALARVHARGGPQSRKIKDSIKYQYRIGDHYDEDIAL